MAKDKTSFVSEAKYHLDKLYNINYSFNDRYGISFILPWKMNAIDESLSYLRRIKEIDGDTYHIIRKIFNIQAVNYYRVKELIRQEPRVNAQKFIGKKNIREFIFKRDKYKCLNCSNTNNLTIDHIVPIHIGGEDKISNLQTLCRSCNSSKSTKIIDYR